MSNASEPADNKELSTEQAREVMPGMLIAIGFAIYGVVENFSEYTLMLLFVVGALCGTSWIEPLPETTKKFGLLRGYRWTGHTIEAKIQIAFGILLTTLLAYIGWIFDENPGKGEYFIKTILYAVAIGSTCGVGYYRAKLTNPPTTELSWVCKNPQARNNIIIGALVPFLIITASFLYNGNFHVTDRLIVLVLISMLFGAFFSGALYYENHIRPRNNIEQWGNRSYKNHAIISLSTISVILIACIFLVYYRPHWAIGVIDPVENLIKIYGAINLCFFCISAYVYFSLVDRAERRGDFKLWVNINKLIYYAGFGLIVSLIATKWWSYAHNIQYNIGNSPKEGENIFSYNILSGILVGAWWPFRQRINLWRRLINLVGTGASLTVIATRIIEHTARIAGSFFLAFIIWFVWLDFWITGNRQHEPVWNLAFYGTAAICLAYIARGILNNGWKIYLLLYPVVLEIPGARAVPGGARVASPGEAVQQGENPGRRSEPQMFD